MRCRFSETKIRAPRVNLYTIGWDLMGHELENAEESTTEHFADTRFCFETPSAIWYAASKMVHLKNSEHEFAWHKRTTPKMARESAHRVLGQEIFLLDAEDYSFIWQGWLGDCMLIFSDFVRTISQIFIFIFLAVTQRIFEIFF